jgi:hypothetical protein
VDLRVCPICSTTFIPRKTGREQVYCSKRCSNRATYLRKKGEPAPPASKPKKKVRKKRAVRKAEVSPDISPERFDDMMDPPGSYEDMLRLSLRTLKTAMGEASPKDLPAISKQLLSVSRELEQYGDANDFLNEDTEVEEDDEEFEQAVI